VRAFRRTKRSDVNVPEYWMKRADDARKTAKDTKDRKVRDAMLGYAQGYERLAQRIEKLSAS
jgi:hypothetical protein